MDKDLPDFIALGNDLRKFRKRLEGMTLARLSAEVAKVAGIRISPTTLHYLEAGHLTRAPTRETLRGVARGLSLLPSQVEDLLRLAGYSVAAEALVKRATEAIESVLQIAERDDGEVFVRFVESCADRFSRSLGARNENVQIALIPVAGWQAQVLAPEIVERMLVPALDEARRAGICEVILIVAPKTSSGWTLRDKFKGLVVRTVEQEQASGLGRALLLGRPANHLGPIAIMLPDEVDPRGEALSELVRQYQGLRKRKSIVGVSPSPTENEKHEILRYYGVAVLKPRAIGGPASRLHELQECLIEKPKSPRRFPPYSRKIAGRYIFTAEIFDTIETTTSELTAALNEHWKTLYAYELRRDLIALAPYKGITEVISSIKISKR